MSSADVALRVRCPAKINLMLRVLGRRADGSVFFFVDSEPVGSEDESPAGQVYGEISNEDRRAFD